MLLVILITNIRVSGVWSLVIVMFVLLLSVFFALTGLWDTIFRLAGKSDAHMTAAAYLALAIPLFIIWLVVLVFYDRLNYATFDRGQFTFHQAFGSGAISFEVMGLSLQKKRDDLFHHWILGIGSGDLVIRTGGGNGRTFEVPKCCSSAPSWRRRSGCCRNAKW